MYGASIDTVSNQYLVSLGWSSNAISRDKTLTVLANFLLAMVQNPDIERNAQDEIDAVLGSKDYQHLLTDLHYHTWRLCISRP